MPADDGIVHVNYDREQEAKPFNAVLYLFNRQVIVAGIVLIFLQPGYRYFPYVNPSSPPVRNITNPR